MNEVKDSRSFMRNFFEQLYQKEAAVGDFTLKLPLERKDRAMWADPECKEEWKQWKLIESTVTDRDIIMLQDELGFELPECLRAFYTVYHHCFDGPVGRHPVSKPFDGLKKAWNPYLVKAGFLPFSWDADGSFIIFIDLSSMPDQNHCPVCQIDHEILFEIVEEFDDNDYEEDDWYGDDGDNDDCCEDADRQDMDGDPAGSIREAVLNNMDELAPNFFIFLNNQLSK